MKHNRIFSWILIVLFITTIGNTHVSYAKGNTSSQVFQDKINILKNEFPDQSFLGSDFQYDASWECVAYAKRICYGVFGTHWNTWERYVRNADNEHYDGIDPDLSNLSIGDCLRFDRKDGNCHMIFVTGIEGDTIYFTDGNWIGYNIVRWDGKISKSDLLNNKDRYYHSYRHAVNYTDVFPSFSEEWVWDDQQKFWKYQLTDGSFAKGWRNIENVKYFFKEDNSLVHSCWYPIDEEWYHFDKQGIMQTGWLEDDANWYYLDETGKMLKSQFALKDGKTYYLGSDGAIVKGICLTIDGIRYDANQSGVITQTSGLFESANVSVPPKSHIPHKESTGTDRKEESTLKITGATKPTTLNLGDYFGLQGIISSNYIILTVTGEIRDSNGNTIQSVTDEPQDTQYSLSGEIDNNLIFNDLSVGKYKYVITASDVSGCEKKLIDQSFSVKEKKKSLQIRIIGATKPNTIREGDFFGLDGKIVSDYPITEVYGCIQTKDGEVVQDITVYPNTTEYSLNGAIDNSLIFNYLSKGRYKYIIIATNSLGIQKTLIDKSFTVK